jgi:uncharacterized protein YndB with AHSA1/START domain
MNNKTTIDFSVNKENKTITVKREFEAPLSLIWDAYTKSEILDKWWAPKPWKAKTKSMDFRPGGKWIYAMIGPEGQEMWSLANYKEIEFQKKYTGVDAFADADGNVNKEMPVSKWEVTFTDKGDSTLVQTQMKFDELEQLEEIIKMGFKEGYATAMEGLDELLPSLKK